MGKNLQSSINLGTRGYLKSLGRSPVVNDDGTDAFYAMIPNPYSVVDHHHL